MTNRLGVLGGTFDPVHEGHIYLAEFMRRLLKLEKLSLMPAALPPHRARPGATAEQRVAMLQLALADHPDLELDLRELQKRTPSYTVGSLSEIRHANGSACSLIFVMGMDTFSKLESWHRWQEILTLAHIVVASRGQSGLNSSLAQLSPSLQAYTEQHQGDLPALEKHAFGRIYFASMPEQAVSATQVRHSIASGNDVSQYLDPAVANYITSQGLYR